MPRDHMVENVDEGDNRSRKLIEACALADGLIF
jgi:hypothetical protein